LDTREDILTATVAKARKGDLKALSWLYDQYAKAMYNTCLRILNNHAKAEDLLHDGFVIAFSKLGKLRKDELFGGWLKSIMIRLCIDEVRKTVYLAELEALDEVADEEMSCALNCTLEEIQAAISLLPNGCRQVFVLYALEDLSHKEISRLLGISVSTSKSQYHRARTLLRSQIQTRIHG